MESAVNTGSDQQNGIDQRTCKAIISCVGEVRIRGCHQRQLYWKLQSMLLMNLSPSLRRQWAAKGAQHRKGQRRGKEIIQEEEPAIAMAEGAVPLRAVTDPDDFR